MGGVRFLEGDQSTRQLEQGEVVLVLLRPADEKRPVAVEPGVAGLDDPAAGTPARSAQLVPDLVAAATDVRGEAALADEVADPRVVVAAVETEALRPGRCRRRPCDRNRLEGCR